MLTQPPMPLWTGLDAAESALIARRRDQRGVPTFGDDADRALASALSSLPHEAAEAARASGRRIGAEVYARRFVEDTLPHAVSVLSHALEASGHGRLALEHSFHRSARIAFHPAAGGDSAARAAFVAGVLEGFFSRAFNCEACAEPTAGPILLELGEGKNVNRKGAAA